MQHEQLPGSALFSPGMLAEVTQVKRLWERAVYLAQRNMAVEQCLVMLKALKPIFGCWVAELAQIAAHAETLHLMLERGFKDAVLSDMEALGRGLRLVAAGTAPSRLV